MWKEQVLKTKKIAVLLFIYVSDLWHYYLPPVPEVILLSSCFAPSIYSIEKLLTEDKRSLDSFFLVT
jgi:hypothetical protein